MVLRIGDMDTESGKPWSPIFPPPAPLPFSAFRQLVRPLDPSFQGSHFPQLYPVLDITTSTFLLLGRAYRITVDLTLPVPCLLAIREGEMISSGESWSVVETRLASQNTQLATLHRTARKFTSND